MEVDLDGIGPFERAVYDVTRAIPTGQTLTYGEVAGRIGEPGAARAVGRALGANPLPIVIPCHRVIRESGELGDYRWGIERKNALIAWEAARVESGAT